MFNSVRKDKKRRTLVKKFEIQRIQNKVLFEDRLLKKELISFFDKKFYHFEKKSKVEKANNFDFLSFWQKKNI